MSRVCIFDIDNTLTHGRGATNKLCCPPEAILSFK